MIPLATTSITAQRWALAVSTDPDNPTDPYDATAETETTPAKCVRATISQPSASVALSGGTETVFSATLACDPCDLQQDDLITDNSDGTIWRVLWTRDYGTFGLGHMTAQLRMISGAAT